MIIVNDRTTRGSSILKISTSDVSEKSLLKLSNGFFKNNNLNLHLKTNR